MEYGPGVRIVGPDCLGPKFGYVYVLRCPDTDQVFYVGSTVNPSARYLCHISDARKALPRIDRASKRESWVGHILLSGKFPVMEIVSVETVDNLTSAEKRLWKSYLDSGCCLVNSAMPSHNIKYGLRLPIPSCIPVESATKTFASVGDPVS